jgi:hypothetical protein
MKQFFAVLLLTASVLLTGCLDIVEDMTIQANGSGTYKTTMDMSGMMEMIEMMAAMDTSAKKSEQELFSKDMDTTILMKDFSDTASNLTAEQKRFFGKGKMNLKMSKQERKFILAMDFPFSTPEEMETLAKMTEGGKGFSMLGKAQNNSILGSATDEAGLPSMDGLFDVQYRKGLLERKINPAKLTAFQKNDKVKEMEQAGEMLEQMKMQTVIHLPAPAKKVTGEKVKLSDDRKTITIQTSFYDLFKNPSAMAYRVEY